VTGISFHRDTVTVIRAAPESDSYGDKIRNWDNATYTNVEGCRVQPATADENTVDRNQVNRRWLLFAPLAADIVATDRIRWQDTDYDIDGEIRRWPSPSGRLDHLEADLIRVEG
jgi:hypothetical protein